MDAQACLSLRWPFARKVKGQNRLESKECNFVNIHLESWLANFIDLLFAAFCSFFSINIVKQIFQKYHPSVEQFVSRPGPTFCWA